MSQQLPIRASKVLLLGKCVTVVASEAPVGQTTGRTEAPLATEIHVPEVPQRNLFYALTQTLFLYGSVSACLLVDGIVYPLSQFRFREYSGVIARSNNQKVL